MFGHLLLVHNQEDVELGDDYSYTKQKSNTYIPKKRMTNKEAVEKMNWIPPKTKKKKVPIDIDSPGHSVCTDCGRFFNTSRGLAQHCAYTEGECGTKRPHKKLKRPSWLKRAEEAARVDNGFGGEGDVIYIPVRIVIKINTRTLKSTRLPYREGLKLLQERDKQHG
jgi:hypothetical protein